MGLYKLCGHNNYRKNCIEGKMKFILRTLKDKNCEFLLKAYNSLKQKYKIEKQKQKFLRRMADSNLNAIAQTFNTMKINKNIEKEKSVKLKYSKKNIIKR